MVHMVNKHFEVEQVPKRSRALLDLAKAYGVFTSYREVSGRVKHVAPETLVAILRSLGAELESADNAARALRERRQMLWDRRLDPVTVIWKGSSPEVLLRLPKNFSDTALHADFILDTGEIRQLDIDLKLLPVRESIQVNREHFVVRSIALPEPIPAGYHRISLELRNRIEGSLIIAAPTRAYSGQPGKKIWGLFLPLYALHSRRSWGAGDFSDLEQLYRFVAGLGGGVVGTLPLHASYLDEPFEPSPYSPISRLFWNEFYIDLAGVPELSQCASARAIMQSIEAKELSELRSSPLVDYRRQMALKRKVLEELSDYFFSEGSHERKNCYEHYLDTHPDAETYARFRAAGERRKQPWTEWPSPLRDGTLSPGDYDEMVKRYHLYVQWVAEEQIERLSSEFRKTGPGLYLDLPLGINAWAYDVWHRRNLFAEHMSVGAPPDLVFVRGQNWGFPPLHPERIRENRYEYVINYLNYTMKYAGIMRIDHVMSLHRLFWIPQGAAMYEGTYVNYPAEEFYAILSVESHKNKCMVVGENLGTVSTEVNKAMARHGLQKMYIIEYELESKFPEVLRTPPADSLAGLNTHDMPQFSAYVKGLDIQDRLELGLFAQQGAEQERANRMRIIRVLEQFLIRKGLLTEPASDSSLLRACLKFLAESRSRVLLVNLEDLWYETLPQNVPTSGDKRPNWMRKSRYDLDYIRSASELIGLLREIDELRKEKKPVRSKQLAA